MSPPVPIENLEYALDNQPTNNQVKKTNDNSLRQLTIGSGIIITSLIIWIIVLYSDQDQHRSHPSLRPTHSPTPRPTRPDSPCEDDLVRLVDNFGGCTGFLQTPNVTCSTDFSTFDPSIPENTLLSDYCPTLCGDPHGTNRPEDLALLFGGCPGALAFNNVTCGDLASTVSPFASPGMTFADICPHTCNQCDCRDDIEPLAQQFGGCSGFLQNPNITCDTPTLGVTPFGVPGANLSQACPHTCDTCQSDLCRDDDLALAVSLGGCDGALSIPGATCDSYISDITTGNFYTPGLKVSDFCRSRCGFCDNFPTPRPTPPPTTPTPAPTVQSTLGPIPCLDNLTRMVHDLGGGCPGLLQRFTCESPIQDIGESPIDWSGAGGRLISEFCQLSCTTGSTDRAEDILTLFGGCQALLDRGDRGNCDTELSQISPFAKRGVLFSDNCPATCGKCQCRDEIEALANEFGGCTGFLSGNNTCDTPTLDVTPFALPELFLGNACPQTCPSYCSNGINCGDDSIALARILGSCDGALSIPGATCETEIFSVFPSPTIRPGLKFSDFCKSRCGVCDDFPTPRPTPPPTPPTPAPTARATRETLPCEDDLVRLVDNFGGCTGFLQNPDVTCNTDFSTFDPNIPENTLLSDYCPTLCGSPEGTNRPEDLALLFGGCPGALAFNNVTCGDTVSTVSSFASPGMTFADICPQTCDQCDCRDDLEPLANQFGGCSGFLLNPNITCSTPTIGVTPFGISGAIISDACPQSCDTCQSDLCRDDSLALAISVGGCDGALSIPGATCDSYISDITSGNFSTPGLKVSDFCPLRCGFCDDFPSS